MEEGELIEPFVPFPFSRFQTHGTVRDALNAAIFASPDTNDRAYQAAQYVVLEHAIVDPPLPNTVIYNAPDGWDVSSTTGDVVDMIAVEEFQAPVGAYLQYMSLLGKDYLHRVKIGDSYAFFPRVVLDQSKVKSLTFVEGIQRRVNVASRPIFADMLEYILRNVSLTMLASVPTISQSLYALGASMTDAEAEEIQRLLDMSPSEQYVTIERLRSGLLPTQAALGRFLTSLTTFAIADLTEGERWDAIRGLSTTLSEPLLHNAVTSLRLSAPLKEGSLRAYLDSNGNLFRTKELGELTPEDVVVMTDNHLPGSNLVPILRDRKRVVYLHDISATEDLYQERSKSGVKTLTLVKSFQVMKLHTLSAQHLINVCPIPVVTTIVSVAEPAPVPTVKKIVKARTFDF